MYYVTLLAFNDNVLSVLFCFVCCDIFSLLLCSNIFYCYVVDSELTQNNPPVHPAVVLALISSLVKVINPLPAISLRSVISTHSFVFSLGRLVEILYHTQYLFIIIVF